MENKLARKIIGTNYKEKFNTDWSKTCTGKTTGYALKFISEAICNPEVPISLSDPSPNLVGHTHKFFVMYVQELITKLELSFLKVNLIKSTLTYEPFEHEDSLESRIRKIVRQELGKE